LIQVDLDGTEKISNVVHVLFRTGAPIVVPNPMLDNATVYFDELPEEGMTLRIMDAGGRTVMNVPMGSTIGSGRFDFSMAGFDAGAYFLTLTNAKGTTEVHARFVKQ